jgi:hypothetical protein
MKEIFCPNCPSVKENKAAAGGPADDFGFRPRAVRYARER